MARKESQGIIAPAPTNLRHVQVLQRLMRHRAQPGHAAPTAPDVATPGFTPTAEPPHWHSVTPRPQHLFLHSLAEIAGTADAASAGADLASRMPCPGPAALAPRDDAAVAAAARLAAPRRRRRTRRQRRAEGEADARAAPANAGAPPAPPSAGEQRDPLQAMREVDLAHELRKRVYTLQSPPGPMRGALKAALTAGLTEVQRDPSSAEGWKLFLLAPRMLLYRGRRETRVPRAELDKRVELLAAGQCRDLLDAAAEAAAGSDVPGPSRANAADDNAQRGARPLGGALCSQRRPDSNADGTCVAGDLGRPA